MTSRLLKDPRERFTCCCISPKDKNVVLFGTNLGHIFQVRLKKLSKLHTESLNDFSCIDIIEPFKLRFKPFNSYIRALKRLDKDNLIVISANGGITIVDLNSENYINIQGELWDTRNRLWRVLIINKEKFITVGSYGKMQIWEKKKNIWKKIIEKRHGSPSFFCLDWYDKDNDKIITNDYRGFTELWNTNLVHLKTWNLASNLQELIKLEDKLITVTRFGDMLVYQEKNDDFFQIERFDCSRSTSVSIIREITNREEFLAGFNDNLFIFNKNFTEYKTAKTSCIDFLLINDQILILTQKDLILLNSNELTVPEDYIKYKYIHVGFIGNSRSGKTTLCQRLIKDEYFSEIPSSLGTHIWLHELTDKQKIYYIDMAGQESELPYYLPKLKTCQIIFVIFRHNQSKNEFLQAIDYYNLFLKRLPYCQIFLIESMIDEREGFSRRLKREILNKNNISTDHWIQVSAKEGKNIDQLLSILENKQIWEMAYPITESTINNAILSILQESFETKFESISVKGMQRLLKEKYANINLPDFRKIIEKLAYEGLMLFLPESDNIILDTSDNQKLQSQILIILHEEQGFIQIGKIIKLCIEDLGNIEFMNEYIYQFLKYLEREELALLIPVKNEIKKIDDIENIILWDALEDKKIFDNKISKFKTISFKLKNPIQIIELIIFATKNIGKISFITRKQIGFEGSPRIIFELDEISSSNSDYTNVTVNIDTSPEKEKIIVEFFKKKEILMFGSQISYSLDQYENLINRGECETIEFKATFKWDIEENRVNKDLPEMATQSVCAFSNSHQGGIIFIGIKDDKSIYGIEKDLQKIFKNIDKFRQGLAQKVREDLGQGVIYNTELIEKEQKQVFIINVKPAKGPIYFKQSQYFVRRGSSNHNCTPRETQDHIRSRFNN